MGETMQLSEFKKIPFLNDDLARRDICHLAFYVRGEWRSWMPAGDEIVEVKMQPVEACYWADEPEKSTDQHHGVLDLIANHLLCKQNWQMLDGLRNDFYNLTASMEKIALYFRVSQNHKISVMRFVTTEIEYITTVCRSAFDLVHKVLADAWSKVSLYSGKATQPLPGSFADVVNLPPEERDSKTLCRKYNRTCLPPILLKLVWRDGWKLCNLRESWTIRLPSQRTAPVAANWSVKSPN